MNVYGYHSFIFDSYESHGSAPESHLFILYPYTLIPFITSLSNDLDFNTNI